MNTAAGSPYAGAVISVGTLHGKHTQFQPAFGRCHHATLHPTRTVDTDLLGTFTGETPRTLTPLEAATAKAHAALDESGGSYALATEASYAVAGGLFGPVIHEELVVFLDTTRGIRVTEQHRGFVTVAPPRTVHTHAEADAYLTRIGFPHQGVVLRADDVVVVKGITDRDTIRRALRRGPVTLEPDLRAHHNPARRRTLRRLSWTLTTRLHTPCPACDAPGYGITGTIPGLPCRWCGAPTRTARADLHSCPACTHHTTHPRPNTSADPATCDTCNP